MYPQTWSFLPTRPSNLSSILMFDYIDQTLNMNNNDQENLKPSIGKK